MTHGGHVLGAHWFNVHQRTAVIKPELSVVFVNHRVAKIHELRRSANVELHALKNRLYVTLTEAQELLDALGVDRACTHPLCNRNLAHHDSVISTNHMRHSCPIHQLPCKQKLPAEHSKLITRELIKTPKIPRIKHR